MQRYTNGYESKHMLTCCVSQLLILQYETLENPSGAMLNVNSKRNTLHCIFTPAG